MFLKNLRDRIFGPQPVVLISFVFTLFLIAGVSVLMLNPVTPTIDLSQLPQTGDTGTCHQDGSTWCSNANATLLVIDHNINSWSECQTWCNANMVEGTVCQYDGNFGNPNKHCYVKAISGKDISQCTWIPADQPPYGSCYTGIKPTLAPTKTNTPTPKPTLTPTVKPTVTAYPTLKPTAIVTKTATVTPTPTVKPTTIILLNSTPTSTPIPTVIITVLPNQSGVPTATPKITLTQTVNITSGVVESITPVVTQEQTDNAKLVLPTQKLLITQVSTDKTQNNSTQLIYSLIAGIVFVADVILAGIFISFIRSKRLVVNKIMKKEPVASVAVASVLLPALPEKDFTENQSEALVFEPEPAPDDF